MKYLLQFFVRLYPAAWRGRYEAEFRALLEEVNPSWRTGLDVLAGALAMQLRAVRSAMAVALLGLVGLLLGLGVWFIMPNQYASIALLKIQRSPGTGRSLSRQAVSEHLTNYAQAAFSRRFLAELIQRHQLYAAEQRKEPLETLIAGMKEHIEIRPAGQDGVSVQFRYYDRPLAKRVESVLVNRLVDVSHEPGVGAGLFDLGILDPPSMPESPISPNPIPLALVGLLAGLLLGFCVAFVRRSPKPV